MVQPNKNLYEYLLKQAPALSAKWLDEASPAHIGHSPVYPLTTAKKENLRFIEIISTLFITHSIPEQELSIWTDNVLKHSMESSITLKDIVHQASRFRTLYWETVVDYIKQSKEFITSEEILQWSTLFHDAYDRVLERIASHFHAETKASIEEKHQELYRISAPIIPLTREIGVLPIVGEITPERAEVILKTTLDEVLSKRLSQLFIDLSGVGTVDTMVAQQLFHIINSLKLLGVHTILSGIKPDIAQTAIHLGIDLSSVTIMNNLRDALYSIGFRIQPETCRT